MAYVRQNKRAIAAPGADPGVVSAYIPITTAETNVGIPVPWDGCKLVHAETRYVSNNAAGALDGGPCEIDLELDAAGGTEIMSIQIASGATVGTLDTASFSSYTAGTGLDSSNVINVEVDGHASTTIGGFNIWLYFEPDHY